MSTNRPERLGHTPLRSKIGIYAVLLVLVGVDYLLLSQSLILLNAASSENGSVGLQMYLITLGFTAMMVAIPHAAAIVARRVTDGLYHRRWLILIGIMLVIWAGVLTLVTVMRIRAGEAAEGTGLSGLEGLETTEPAADPFGPETLMALLTVFFVTSTGLLSWYAAYHSSRPLLAAVERAEATVQWRQDAVDEATAAVTQAEGDLDTAQEEDARDEERLRTAKQISAERLMQLRSQVATLIAESDGSPESTSEMIRSLRDIAEQRRSDHALAS